jgi:CheY-like chemotaxis protein
MMIDDPIVLLVDDSVNDATLLRAVFERAGFVEPLRSTQDVDEAIAYLRGDGAYADRSRFPLPTAVLLDVNMPRRDGFELLEWIRQQPSLKRLRVFILSASGRPQDIERAYDLGANSYLVKPRNLDGLLHLAKSLVSWLRLNHFAAAPTANENHADDQAFATSTAPRRSVEYSGLSVAR